MGVNPAAIIRGVLIFLVTFAAVLAATSASFAQSPSRGIGPGRAIDESFEPTAADPIAGVGYGLMFDAQGKVIEPTPAFRRRALDYYLNRLIGEAPGSLRAEYQEVRKRLEANEKAYGIDEILSQSLLIDWLINKLKPDSEAHLAAKNRTLRLGHVKDNAGERADWRFPDHQFGLPRVILDFALDNGILFKSTSASGREYIAQCREAGVPIPPTWGTVSWVHEGDLTTNFVGSGNPASVFTAESTSPDGICVALPRISGNTISLLGIICLGRDTSNVCFWDRANTPVNAQVPIEDFLGGAALGDVCSDCHAGENPYVVHPGSPLDLGNRIKTTAWYTPLVKPSWPQNPGPSILPEIVPLGASDLRCTSCHTQGFAGRFPEVGALNFYCPTVLNNAINQTMPPGAPGDPGYAAHADAMRAFCDQRPPGGSEVPGGEVKDDPEYVSPPIVIGPLYGCAEAIEVRGAIRHALLTVFINGVDLPQVTAVDPDQQYIAVPALVPGDEVYATQIVDGLESGKSNVEIVRDHTVDFPMGLPKPEIDPTLIYQCGNVIAVRHLRGAKVTVYTNGTQPVTYSTGGDWTNLPPAGAPFGLNDKFQAEYRMCSDVSPKSNEESAVAAPSTIPTPALDPPTVFQGQELVTVTNLLNGAQTKVTEGSGAGSVSFSTAVDWMPNIDIAAAIGGPLASGQALTVESKLCASAPRIKTAGAKSCEEIPAPAIQQPFVGQSAVTVTAAIPGARILVYDQALDEIGDGSGGLVPLSRSLVAGDVLLVVQRVGQCTSANAYQVAVLCTSTKQDC
jgi:hypothetical protein